MKRWEYKKLIITSSISYSAGRLYSTFKLTDNGESLNDCDSEEDTWQYIQDVGEDGFELVSVKEYGYSENLSLGSNTSTSSTELWFKRPIE